MPQTGAQSCGGRFVLHFIGSSSTFRGSIQPSQLLYKGMRCVGMECAGENRPFPTPFPRPGGIELSISVTVRPWMSVYLFASSVAVCNRRTFRLTHKHDCSKLLRQMGTYYPLLKRNSGNAVKKSRPAAHYTTQVQCYTGRL